MSKQKVTLRHWTKQEDDFIRANYSRMAVSDIAQQLKRSTGAARDRIERLNIRLSSLKRNTERFWTKDELGIIQKFYKEPIINIQKLLPNKSFHGIYYKCREYGRPKKYIGWHYDSYGRKQISLGNGKSVAEHRFLVEQNLGRKLQRKEQVHHVNCDKTDNRIENLYLFTDASSHLASHRSLEKLIKELMERNIIKFDSNRGRYKICKNQ